MIDEKFKSEHEAIAFAKTQTEPCAVIDAGECSEEWWYRYFVESPAVFMTNSGTAGRVVYQHTPQRFNATRLSGRATQFSRR